MSDFASLQARIEKLERQAGVQRNLIVALIALVAIAGTVAGTRAQQQAVSFTDASGKTRVMLDANGLVLNGPDGAKRLAIGAFTDGDPYIQVYDSGTGGVDGNRRIYLGYSSKESPVFMLNAANGKPLIEADGTDIPDEYFYDTSGVERAVLGLATGGQPLLEMYDSGKTERLFTGLTTDASPLVRMYSGSGQQTMEMSGQDRPFFRVNQADGTERGYLGVSTGGSSILKLFSTTGVERIFAGEYTDSSSGFSAYNLGGTSTWASR